MLQFSIILSIDMMIKHSVSSNCNGLRFIVSQVRNPGRDISFPIFTKKEIETKIIGKEIKIKISRLNDLPSFLSNIEQNRN